MAAWITFGGLKRFVGKDTKELVVPSGKKLLDRKTQAVISGRFGRFQEIKVVQDGRIAFLTAHPGTFEDVTLYPVGGSLEGHDLSVVNRRVMVRWEGEEAFCINETDSDVRVFMNGEDEKEALPYYRKKHMDTQDDTVVISVFMDGSVVYRTGAGRQTVFSLCKCRDYQYKSVTRGVHIREEDLEVLGWDVRLTMFAEDRLAHNNLNHKKEIAWNSADDSGEDMTDSDEKLWKLFREEYQRAEYRRDLAEEIMLSLGETERKIMEMYYFERDSQREIAKKLGIARETVSRKMTRILRMLREEYRA